MARCRSRRPARDPVGRVVLTGRVLPAGFVAVVGRDCPPAAAGDVPVPAVVELADPVVPVSVDPGFPAPPDTVELEPDSGRAVPGGGALAGRLAGGWVPGRWRRRLALLTWLPRCEGWVGIRPGAR